MVVDNWDKILKYSLQWWLNILAAFLSFCEFALPYIQEVVYVPPKLFLVLSFVVIITANLARLKIQNSVSGGSNGK